MNFDMLLCACLSFRWNQVVVFKVLYDIYNIDYFMIYIILITLDTIYRRDLYSSTM